MYYQIKRCQANKHNDDFNTHHTKLLFDKLSATNIDLSTTRNELQATRNELQVSRNELSTACNKFQKTNTKLGQKLSATKNELSSTRNELRETNSKLEKATTELLQLKNNLSTRSTPTHQSATPQATKRRSNATATPPKQIEEIIPLMEEVVRPNQPRVTQSSYCNNVKHMSELMTIGQLYFMNEEECFFKIRLQKNNQYLRIYLVEDIARYRNDEYNVFEYEDIVLGVCSSCYVLFVSIRKHDQKNSKGFLIDTKRSGNNRLLEYGDDYNIGWNEYKDFNDCLLFYFTKK